MDRRSTSAEYTHFGGDVTAQVNSSHGARLSGGSTGGILESVGDDTNVSLRVRAQGAGRVIIGAAGQPLDFNSTGVAFSSGSVVQVGSTAPFAGFIRQNSSFATPNFNTTNAMVMVSTITVVGVNSSHFIVANPANLSTDCSLLTAKVGSTANSVNLTFLKASTLTVAAATGTVRLLAFRF